jgi:hypothetical protein
MAGGVLLYSAKALNMWFDYTPLRCVALTMTEGHSASP